MTPTVVLEVILELPPLHVITDMEAQVGIYKRMCNQQCRPKSTNSDHTTNFRYGAWTYPRDGVGQDASEIRIPQAFHGQVPRQVLMAEWVKPSKQLEHRQVKDQ
jgi:hypothetical protein